MQQMIESLMKKKWFPWALFFTAMIAVFFLGLFAANIMERRAEGMIAFAPTKEIKELEPDSKVWGEAYKRQYDSYLKTKDTSFKSKHNSSSRDDMLKKNPAMVVLWAGYPFSLDYNSPRGHIYAITDIRETLRTGAPKDSNDGPLPNTCWTCKSPDVPRMMKEVGVAEFYKGTWASRGDQIVNPIGCADCHDAKTMDLTITRPALIEALKRRNVDLDKITHQEKRSLVCAQCHVEYYFKGKDKYLTFPWDKGFKVEEIEKYYDEINFSDWTHALSKAPMLKAQHPEYETWQMGVHADRGVSCADCHMPYISEGGIKYSDHHWQSPLNSINRSCQVCHRESEEKLKENVFSRQDKIAELRTLLESELVKLHLEAGRAWELGVSESVMKPILTLIRHAQWRWDFSVASHGASFHAPLEIARIMATAINKAQDARTKLAYIFSSKGIKDEMSFPDTSSKEKAQKLIGINLEALQADKKRFLENLVPTWDKR